MRLLCNALSVLRVVSRVRARFRSVLSRFVCLVYMYVFAFSFAFVTFCFVRVCIRSVGPFAFGVVRVCFDVVLFVLFLFMRCVSFCVVLLCCCVLLLFVVCRICVFLHVFDLRFVFCVFCLFACRLRPCVRSHLFSSFAFVPFRCCFCLRVLRVCVFVCACASSSFVPCVVVPFCAFCVWVCFALFVVLSRCFRRCLYMCACVFACAFCCIVFVLIDLRSSVFVVCV